MPELQKLRDRIDAIDRAVVDLLNERATIAMQIGRKKLEEGLPVYDPSREEEIIRNVTTSLPGPLAAQAMRRVFERIIDETRSVERRSTEPTDPHEA
jgi:chorismate mutase